MKAGILQHFDTLVASNPDAAPSLVDRDDVSDSHALLGCKERDLRSIQHRDQIVPIAKPCSPFCVSHLYEGRVCGKIEETSRPRPGAVFQLVDPVSVERNPKRTRPIKCHRLNIVTAPSQTTGQRICKKTIGGETPQAVD